MNDLYKEAADFERIAETLERIVRTVRRAPSAGFSQGQRLVVVTDPERRAALADAAGEEFYVEQGFPPWISGAAALVAVCTREEDYHDRYRQPDKVVDGEEIEGSRSKLKLPALNGERDGELSCSSPLRGSFSSMKTQCLDVHYRG